MSKIPERIHRRLKQLVDAGLPQVTANEGLKVLSAISDDDWDSWYLFADIQGDPMTLQMENLKTNFFIEVGKW